MPTNQPVAPKHIELPKLNDLALTPTRRWTDAERREVSNRGENGTWGKNGTWYGFSRESGCAARLGLRFKGA